jgi:hypothetical protein
MTLSKGRNKLYRCERVTHLARSVMKGREGKILQCIVQGGRLVAWGERYPANAHKQFLLCLLIPLHVSASRCLLHGVKIFLFISYFSLSAFRVGVGYSSLLSCLLIPLHVSASRCLLQGVKIFLYISYSSLSAFRVGVGYSSLLSCLLIPLHISVSKRHLQGVTISLFISYSSFG